MAEPSALHSSPSDANAAEMQFRFRDAQIIFTFYETFKGSLTDNAMHTANVSERVCRQF